MVKRDTEDDWKWKGDKEGAEDFDDLAIANFDALMAGAKKRGLTGSEGERAGKRARHIRFSD